MLDWIRGRRRGGEERRRKLMLALARAEQNLVETHVRNALDLYDAMEDDLPLEDALATYLDALVPNRAEAEIVARKVLTRGQLHAGGRDAHRRPVEVWEDDEEDAPPPRRERTGRRRSASGR